MKRLNKKRLNFDEKVYEGEGRILKMKKAYREYFHVAQAMTSKSEHPRFHHGSVVVMRNTIIGKGSNYGFIHAEVSSLLNCENVSKSKSFLDQLVVFVCRVNSQGLFMNSKPCYGCQRFMKRMGINKVIYTIDEDTVGKMRFD